MGQARAQVVENILGYGDLKRLDRRQRYILPFVSAILGRVAARDNHRLVRSASASDAVALPRFAGLG